MRVLLIRQTTSYSYSELGNGIGIIGTILSQGGHEVKIVDNNSLYKRYSNNKFCKIIRLFKPDVVAFGITIYNTLETYNLVHKIKVSFPDIMLVAGGIHMKFSYEEALRNGLDIIVNREGEKVVLPLFEHLETRIKTNFREGLNLIPGISYLQENGTVFVSSEYPALDDLDKVPMINYDLFNIDDYRKTLKEPGFIYIIGQRGCPYRCNFCSDDFQRNDKRVASAEWLFQNVKYLYSKFGFQYISICDNNFMSPRQRAIDFCNKIIQSGMNKHISFSCQTKIDSPLDDELLSLINEAGFSKIRIGLERLDQYSTKMIKKPSSIKRVHNTLSLIKKHEIEIGIFILLGFPFETVGLLEKERDAFKSLTMYTHNFICSILQPSPGTIYYDNYPKAKKWYLMLDAFLIRRAYFANVLDTYMIGQIDLGFFDLPDNTRKKIKDIYLEFKLINYGNFSFVAKRTLFYIMMLKLDLFLARISQLFFSISPSLEYWIFRKVSFFRYYFGTLFFGERT